MQTAFKKIQMKRRSLIGHKTFKQSQGMQRREGRSQIRSEGVWETASIHRVGIPSSQLFTTFSKVCSKKREQEKKRKTCIYQCA